MYMYKLNIIVLPRSDNCVMWPPPCVEHHLTSPTLTCDCPPCPLTVLLRRVSGSKSRATCLYNAPSHRVNKMKFQDDFGYPLLGYPKLVSAMPHSVLGYFILLPRARPSMERRLISFQRNPSYRSVAISDK